MIEFFDSSAKLVGHSGSILLPDDDEITRKLAMLFEGQCEGLGPTQAARKFGYTKQRYFQLLNSLKLKAPWLCKAKRAGQRPTIGVPKRWSVRSFVIVSWIRMLRPRSLLKSSSKLTILLAFGASSESSATLVCKKNSTPVALKACPSKSRPSGPDANSAPNRAIRPALSERFANCWPTKFPATKSESGSWLLSIFAWALGICSALGARAADRLSGHAWLYTWSMRRLSVSTVYATSAP